MIPLLCADAEAFADVPAEEREVLVGAARRYLHGLKSRFDAFEPDAPYPAPAKTHPRTKDSGNKE